MKKHNLRRIMYLMNFIGIATSTFVIGWFVKYNWVLGIVGFIGVLFMITANSHGEIAAALKRKGRLEDD